MTQRTTQTNTSSSGFTRTQSKKNVYGFTLIEMMVSVAIFAIIMVVGTGALVSMTNAYRVGQQEKQVHDSLNYVLEMMTRDIRLGYLYHRSPNLNGSDQGSANDGTASSFGFNAADDRGYVIFYLSDNGILYRNRYTPTGSSLISQDPLTNPDEVVVSGLRFSVRGTDSYEQGDLNQPRVWIQLRASSSRTPDRETVVQALVSQRILDF